MTKVYKAIEPNEIPDVVIVNDDIQVEVTETKTEETVDVTMTSMTQLKANKKRHEDAIVEIDTEIVEVEKVLPVKK